MWVRRMSINHLIQIEEPRIRNPLLAEGLETIERRGRKKPRRTDGDGPWSSGDLGGRRLMESFSQFLGCDEVGGEGATRDRLELGAGEGGWSAEGVGRAGEDGDSRHGVRQDLLWDRHEECDN